MHFQEIGGLKSDVEYIINYDRKKRISEKVQKINSNCDILEKN